ncbi:MAG: anti-sigma factor antagonist [Paenibacillaceae bacterium]|jgi:anti-sigma B factor antagonist|nr:anti-sigma factor antagonist [Paenibacillaceae bacterium]
MIKSFRTVKQISDKAVTFSFIGEFDLSRACELQGELDSYLQERQRDLIFDFKELRYIDSTGIGILITVIKARAEINAGFEILHIPPHIERLFDIAGISRFLNKDAI